MDSIGFDAYYKRVQNLLDEGQFADQGAHGLGQGQLGHGELHLGRLRSVGRLSGALEKVGQAILGR